MCFRPGSVVASFVLIYNKNQVNVRLQAKSIMHTYLVKHWSMLGTYHIDMGSVRFTGQFPSFLSRSQKAQGATTKGVF